jgi:hypothetical protein
MADRLKLSALRGRARRTAGKSLARSTGFPVPPRKAMSLARKASKKLQYPLAPYARANSLQLAQWAAAEWGKLGRWKSLALPVVLYTAYRTWQDEIAQREEYLANRTRRDVQRDYAKLYGSFGEPPRRRRLLGIIPLRSAR